ncbi:MAG: hypothetical protein MK171_05650, partial [Pirellulales bacterium]|nr:hypothetical protein [Pirellulales bacterium]
AIGQIIADQGEKLIVCIVALRSLGARVLSALEIFVSMLAVVLRDDVWHGMRAAWVKPRAGVARCFAVALSVGAKQHRRRHPRPCHRSAG